ARQGDPVQAGAGVELHAKPGDVVGTGQPLMRLHTDEPARFARALAALDGAWTIAPAPQQGDHPRVVAPSVVLDRLG
ncbi:MAG: thymidine phosphorylase, partial [Nocardioidaceae bacterium]|nr:thymidine phosphorylase [Nocardioidaceae bacterium]